MSTSGCATLALASRRVARDPPTAAAPLSVPQFGPCDFESWIRKEADPVSTSGCATLALASRLVTRDPPTTAAPLSVPASLFTRGGAYSTPRSAVDGTKDIQNTFSYPVIP